MCFDIRELDSTYTRKAKKVKGFGQLEILEELANYSPNQKQQTDPKKRKNTNASTQGSKKKKKTSLTLRSKNKFIDHALCVEDEANYTDIYADLEDWIDDSNWSPSKQPRSIYDNQNDEDE